MWQSIRPGSTVSAERSITFAPAGTVTDAPPSFTLPPSITITAPGTTVPALGSIRRPAFTAITSGCAAAAAAAKPRRNSDKYARIKSTRILL